MSALSSLQGSTGGVQPAVPVSPAPAAAGKAFGQTAAAASPARARVRTTPLLGRLSLKWQSIILLGALAITVGAAIAISAYERQSDRVNALQNEVVGDALMHSQRLAKAANMAVQGNEEAYDQLKSSQAFLSDAVPEGTDGAADGSAAALGSSACRMLRSVWMRSVVSLLATLMRRRS